MALFHPSKIQQFCLTLASVLLCLSSSSAEDNDHWKALGEQALERAKTLKVINKPAKNVILFLGDGMGITTITASRIFAGQQLGKSGEDHQLSFEKLPWVALSKTYSANQQTPDSAPTMTAIVTGVKTNDGFLSVSSEVRRGETDSRLIEAHRLTTLLEQAEAAGLATGVITTTRVTHATPAANYAHTAERDWETDSQLPPNSSVKDIAAQLIDNFKAVDSSSSALGIEVVMGGGRSYLLPESIADPEYPESKGKRKDGRNLIAEYQQKFGAEYVWNKAQFEAIDVRKTTKLLALFEPSHMHYDFDRPQDKAGEPSLAEMTAKAIAILQNNRKGYFLMVEGGRIDHAHHDGNAYRALHDTVAFADAVQAALDNTNGQETLIIVTADHSHTLSMAGYPKRGNPILGKVTLPGKSSPELDSVGQPFTTLGYANGMGSDHTDDQDKEVSQPEKSQLKQKSLARKTGRLALGNVDTQAPDYHQQALVPLANETHGGEDVAIFAGGPMAHLLHGVQEQSYIYYVMHEALGLK